MLCQKCGQPVTFMSVGLLGQEVENAYCSGCDRLTEGCTCKNG